MQNFELLAPAGSIESVQAALYCGADAIYIGLKSFSARQNAVNFDYSELDGVISLCHLFGAKVYVAVNTIVFDNKLCDFADCIKKCAELGVDAFIVQDLGALEIIKKVAPEATVHASTQLTVHTPQGAEFAKKLGFSRVVVSRELSMQQIEKICKTKIEVEAFVHGALCMSVSGQCYMSAMFGSRSANRGLCAQPCRLPFSHKKGCDEHCLSLKDLSLIEHIGKLKEIGVCSFKIEGRMKRPEYVAAAVSAYRKAIDGKNYDISDLSAVFSRQGFTDGYFTANLGNAMFGMRDYENVLDSSRVQSDIRKSYEKMPKIYTVDFALTLKGLSLELSATADSVCVCKSTDISQYSSMNPLKDDAVKKQLSKLGNTIFELGSINSDIPPESARFPLSVLNALRRDIIAHISEEIVKKNSVYTQTFEYIHSETATLQREKPLKFRAYFESVKQLSGVSADALEFVLLPLAQIERNCNELASLCDKVIIVPPRFINDEEQTFKRIEKLRNIGFKRLYCNNIAYLSINENVTLHGGFGLNCANSECVRALKELGVSDIECSFELKASQINKLSRDIPVGIVAFGKLPLMLNKNCPIGDCKNCFGKIYDRTNRAFDIKCPKNNEGYAEILNCTNLEMSDKLSDMAGIDFATLIFHDESGRECEEIINRYLYGTRQKDAEYTRGLYYRGVK
ncbi:MAG: U32 family peptidase [Oscillospiraceae bacterium]|nr:U32 family peptidase [Oscillospiraceae bacterium]